MFLEREYKMTGTIANASSARTLNRAMNEGIRSAWRKAECAQSRRAGGSYLRDAHIASMLTETRGLEIKYGNAYYPVQDDEARRVMSYITRHIGFSEKGTKIIKNFLRYMSGTQRWKGRIRVSRVQWNVFKEHADKYYAKQGDG